MADSAGTVYAGVDLDPWGRETARGWNQQVQPRRYTSYTRDSNDSDEAMHRRYNRWHLRFDQPDPTDASYDLSDPQSLNRYAYTRNDPVNLTDPSGLSPKVCQMYHGEIVCSSDNSIFPSAPGADRGFGGWGGGSDIDSRPSAGREIIALRENASYPFFIVRAWNDRQERVTDLPFVSMFLAAQQGRFVGSRGIPQKHDYQIEQENFDDCAQAAWRKYRKTYLGTSLRAVIGGVGLGVGMSALIGIRGIGLGVRGAIHAAQDTALDGVGRALTAGVELAHGSGLGTAFSVISGKMAGNAIRDAERNSQRLSDELNDCWDRYPGADPSKSWLNF